MFLAKAPRALADPIISNIAPTNESGDLYRDNTPLNGTSTPPSPQRPWFYVAWGSSNSPVAWQKIYVPLTDTGPVHIIIQSGGGWCYNDPAYNAKYNLSSWVGPDQFYPDVTYTINALAADETTNGAPSFQTSADSLYSPAYNTTCRDMTLTIPANLGVASTVPGHENYRVFFFKAILNTTNLVCTDGKGVPLPDNCDSTGYYKDFRLCADTCTEGGSPVLIGFSRTVDTTSQMASKYPFGVSQIPLEKEYQIDPGPGRPGGTAANSIDWTYHFYFAPQCDENNPTSKIDIFDADWGNTYFVPQYLTGTLWSAPRNGSGPFTVAQSWDAATIQGGAYGASNTQSTIQFSTTPTQSYKVSLNQFNYHNIIQFYVPLDQIDAANNVVTCLKAASCSIVPQDVEPGDDGNITATIQLQNPGYQPVPLNQPNSNNGYNVHVTSTGGITIIPGSLSSTPLVIPITAYGVFVNVRVNMTARIDSDGQITLDLYNGNATADVPGLPCTLDLGAASKPYFQVWNGGTAAGGGFKESELTTGSGSCGQPGDPPYISPQSANVSPVTKYSGGILSYADNSTARGSSTDFGAVALGLIPESAGGPAGFHSGVNVFFSNDFDPTTPPNEGYLNSDSKGHCVGDFYTDTRTGPNPPNLFGNPGWWNSGSGQYILPAGDNTLSGMPTGTDIGAQQITFYSDHDVTITGNINYPSSFNAGAGDFPYFALIVKGNITLTNNVTKLDGLYVAQPVGSSKGVFATCDSMCNQQLVVNGAVIAQDVDLLRAHGTLTAPAPGYSGNIGGSPAEIINFVPSMVIGVPNFQPDTQAVNNIYNLSPVF